jgi:homoserine O-succinyltransferase/O-acetyltransferase
MTIVLPNNYHAKPALLKQRIHCIEHEEALKKDIRPLRIGILNIMPHAETYEYSLLHPLGRTLIQVEPIWIKLDSHDYNSTQDGHIDNLYKSFDEVMSEHPLDGLILTGAPVEEIPFEEVRYWEEVKKILLYAKENIASTLGICWGGLALAKVLGIEKNVFKKKIFGVYETRNIDTSHPITGSMDDVFWCPFSSYSSISNEILELEKNRGNLNLLAFSGNVGYTIFESTDHKFLMHLGHPEYEATRFGDEYLRDKRNGISIDLPENVDIDNPQNRWRSHCFEFFAQWIKYIYEETPY